MADYQKMANTLRMLALDAVNQANSGHPGMPMGMADVAVVVWHDFLKHNPSHPAWLNRDRFVLSNGHGSMLHYALLHMSGYDVSMDDLRAYRQLHSKTPGHPERGHTAGVETTTGPLGQGLANGVGMALAERVLAAEFNRPDAEVVDHHTYVFTGDGCLMEGVSHEACSLAGTLQLGKLIVLYDDNGISIDGDVAGWFADDTAKRFAAYGWQVIESVDGHDHAAIRAALSAAQQSDRPSIIMCQTKIGFGSPNFVGTAKSHGSPLGEAERVLVAEKLGWEHAPFEVPQQCYDDWNACARGAEHETAWEKQFADFKQAHSEAAQELVRRMQGTLPDNWSELCDEWLQQMLSLDDRATRQSCQAWLNLAQPYLPELIGGSADLTGSNGTLFKDAVVQSVDQPAGKYVHYGVREFGMSAIMNGMAAHGGLVPYAGTFLVFSDYSRNAIRMAALMRLKVVFVLTHDSIALGGDGPTHQPIEHLTALRSIPNLDTWRPADNAEVAVAWQEAIAYDGPSALCLTRQKVQSQSHTTEQLTQIKRGAYVLSDTESINVILLATGSEVELAMAAKQQLAAHQIAARVVSMPCMERFLCEDSSYRQKVLPQGVTTYAIEAGCSMPWHRFASSEQHILSVDGFGASAPPDDMLSAFGFTVEGVVSMVLNTVGQTEVI